MLDRLLHHCHTIVTDGDGSRVQQARATGATTIKTAAVLGEDTAPPPPQSTATTVATANLQPVTDTSARGTASLLRVDGRRVLRLTLPRADGGQDTGFREVWLLDTAQGQLVSLGVLEGPRGSFTLPRNLDLADYPTVDVSTEPFDGDPTHSGDSLARGNLTF